jgi:SAM-dependent methyltransferase
MGPSRNTRDFYNAFAAEVLLEDFGRLNQRQDAVRELCREFVPRGARVLEVGCGAGINAKFLQTIASHVVGIDISDRNIEVAREYASAPNAVFKVLDVLHSAEDLSEMGPFDAIVLPDVIEHVPLELHGRLFEALESVLAERGRVILTYPSPEYQEHLKKHEPKKLQLVDETVELADILRHTSLRPCYFRYRDVWHVNQYVHLVLTSDRSFRGEEAVLTPVERFRYRVRKRTWRYRNRAFLKRMRRRFSGAGGAGG